MEDIFSSSPSELLERFAIPKSFSIDIGVKSSERLKEYLWKVIHNEKANKTLYYRLLEAGFNKPVLIKDIAIELLPGKFIKVYFVLKESRKGFRGYHGVTGLIFKESRIVISLYADTDSDSIVWSDTYDSTIDHEVAHAFQAIETAIRYLQFKNKNIPNYTPSYDDIMKYMVKVDYKSRGQNVKFKDKFKNPEVYTKYLSSSKEVGARAHALLRELGSYNIKLLEEIIDHYETGWPSFEYINSQLNKGKWHGWSELSKHGKTEMDAWGVREEETYSYAIKQELLKALYELYRIHYKK